MFLALYPKLWLMIVNGCCWPHVGDQIINARLMAGDLKVGVEVEKGEEDGLSSKDDVRKAVMTVMDDDSKVGKEARANLPNGRSSS